MIFSRAKQKVQIFIIQFMSCMFREDFYRVDRDPIHMERNDQIMPTKKIRQRGKARHRIFKNYHKKLLH